MPWLVDAFDEYTEEQRRPPMATSSTSSSTSRSARSHHRDRREGGAEAVDAPIVQAMAAYPLPATPRKATRDDGA